MFKNVFYNQTDGKCGPGRPKMSWRTLTERNCCEWKLKEVDPYDRNVWKLSMRSAMLAAMQLPGG